MEGCPRKFSNCAPVRLFPMPFRVYQNAERITVSSFVKVMISPYPPFLCEGFSIDGPPKVFKKSMLTPSNSHKANE